MRKYDRLENSNRQSPLVNSHNFTKHGFLTKALEFFSKMFLIPILVYRISSYSFRGNYSFLNLEIQRSKYIRPKVTVHKDAETIQGRKLFKGGNYSRKYGT